MPKTSYGTISTMEQEQRQGRYRPHRNVSRFQRADRVTMVKCFDCGEAWEHPTGDPGGTPSRCKRAGAGPDAG